MAGWLPLAISKDCGYDSRSLQDGWEMIGWLSPNSSKDVGCNRKSPRDGWEMAGWLALVISKDFGRDFGTVGDGWEMVGRAHVVVENPIQHKTIGTTNNHRVQREIRTRWLGGWLWLFQTHLMYM